MIQKGRFNEFLFKHAFVFFILVLTNFNAFSQSTNSIDVLNYKIQIKNIDFKNKLISGITSIRLRICEDKLLDIRLSLRQLTVDSIKANGKLCRFKYDGELISIFPENEFNINDTLEYLIYYHGHPKTDPSGWGGFYFKEDYAFNLGISFSDTIHNSGKSWFPCNDNFTDRAYFNFEIATSIDNKAICNGILKSKKQISEKIIIWKWEMKQRIPPYLVGIAVGPYFTLESKSNNISIEISCLAKDSQEVKKSFIHLDKIVTNLIQYYGPYPYDKIGFTLVPFNRGAMEHASNIFIGKVFIDGSLNYESLWAHELSHMWWGDYVTCSDAKEMWLNEGFASYSEILISEKLYGMNIYKSKIQENHRNALQFSSINDSGIFALNNIPLSKTYGSTVYKKSIDVIYTLRNYLGDSLFFKGCKYYLQNRGDGNATSLDLSNDLSKATGINTNDFFNDWINTKGYPHFSIDSITKVNDDYFIFTRQRSKGNSHQYKMSIELYFANREKDSTVTILVDSITNKFHLKVSFKPLWFALNHSQKIADAIISDEVIIDEPRVYLFKETNVKINVNETGVKPSTLRIELNYIKPDSLKKNIQGLKLSTNHYWKIDGIIDQKLNASATFEYNGTTSLNDGYLENELISGSEINLVLLHRSNCGEDWEIIQSVIINSDGNLFDKKGSIFLPKLLKGEYVLGYLEQEKN